jgi:glutamate-5-semialdehyde dehydrogenase
VTVQEQAERARTAALTLSSATRATKDAALIAMADALAKSETAILEANQRDVSQAEANGTSGALIDRLRLTPDRIAGMVEGLRDLASLPDPVGDVVRGWTNANGVQVRQVRVPFGVVGIIYEARHLSEIRQRRAASGLIFSRRVECRDRRRSPGRPGRCWAPGRCHPTGTGTA